MSDIVQEIINAADLASKWEPDHPQYVEGALYLTQAQWDAVRDQYPPNAERRHLATHHAWGIPVHIVKPDERVPLPSGKVLVYSRLLESFYVFNETEAAMSACPWCGKPYAHYMTHVCAGCECFITERRIPGEPHMPSYYEAERNPDCPVHFPVGQVLTEHLNEGKS